MSNKRYIVLDLFIIHAITSSDLDLYVRTVALLQLIKDKCHKIVLSPSLIKEYERRLNNLKNLKEYTSEHLLKYMNQLLRNSEKISKVKDLEYDIRVKVPEKDKPIIKTALAQSGNTIIVTTNRKDLINNTELQEHLKKYNILILSLEKALDYIRDN